MKRTQLISIILALCFVAIGAVAGGFHGSHPDSPNNGKDSPRFYASPPGHPQHP